MNTSILSKLLYKQNSQKIVTVLVHMVTIYVYNIEIKMPR